jgi:hypothetical protein
MDDPGIPKNVLNGKFHGRKCLGRPQLRWKANIRRDSSLLLNTHIRGRRGVVGERYREANFCRGHGPMLAVAPLMNGEVEDEVRIVQDVSSSKS